jgi:2-dehydro-3-deoxyphosphooctonate aldolase (KDO 8-P synthase)
MYEFSIKDIEFFPNNKLILIAGPCVIESEEHTLFMADTLKKLAEKFNIPYIFKSSYQKANRSSIDSFVGPGLDEGLNILQKIKLKLNLPVISDVHSIEQIKPASEILDIIQIPAFLCRQTDLITSAANTGKIINIKKGQFLAPNDVRNVINKVYSTGNKKILITERGTTFGYNNLVVDMRSLEIIKNLGVPVVFDATHSVQLPGGAGDKTGGQREFIPTLARAAIAIGVNALFVEVHDNPDKGKSDAANMLSLDGIQQLLPLLIKIDNLIKDSGNE